MKGLLKLFDPKKYRLAFIVFLLVNFICTGQGLKISQGTIMSSVGGNLVLKGDLENNGTCINSDNTVVFNGISQTLEGNTPVSFNNLTAGSGTDLTMTTPGQTVGGIVLSNGVINSDGNLILLSTEARTALIDGSGTGQVTGNVTIQRYLPLGFGYKYFSSPFQDAHVSEFSDNMKLDDPFPAFYRYDESRLASGWVTYIDPAGILSPMEGYAINFGSSDSPITFDVTGVVNNGTLSLDLFNHNNTYTKGFSLVGNPYPSPVDWDIPSGWIRTNVDNAVYYFEASTTDEYGGSYDTWINSVSSNDSVTNLIPSMQGFFVHVSDGAWPVAGSITINNDARVIDLTHPLIKSDASERQLIRLVAGFSGDSLSFDPLVIYFDEKATDEFDGQLDALKLMNTDYMVANFYTIGSDGRKLSISALPFITDTLYRVPLGLTTVLDGNIIFGTRDVEGEFTDMEIYLSDDLAGEKQQLREGDNYEVFLPAGVYENRFFLEFKNLATGIPEDPQGENMFNVYAFRGILKLEINTLPAAESIMTVTSITGQTLIINKYYEPGFYEINAGLKSGVYIVTFTSGTEKSSKKIFIDSR